MFITLAVERICTDLGLPPGDGYTQNWAYELGPEYRTEEHFQRYLEAYRDERYGAAERDVLIQLILDIVNDRFIDDEMDGDLAWDRVTLAVGEESLLAHEDEMRRWACVGKPLEDSYALTPYVRNLLEPPSRLADGTVGVELAVADAEDAQRLLAVIGLGMARALGLGLVTPSYAVHRLFRHALVQRLQACRAPEGLVDAANLATEVDSIQRIVPHAYAEAVADLESRFAEWVGRLKSPEPQTGYRWLCPPRGADRGIGDGRLGAPVGRMPSLYVERILEEEAEGWQLAVLKSERSGASYVGWALRRRSGWAGTLVVRTDEAAIADYLAWRISTRELFTVPNDDVGFLVDADQDDLDESDPGARLVAVSTLPETLLPPVGAFHAAS